MKKTLLTLLLGLSLSALPAQAAAPIKIGGIGPYNGKAFFMQPADNGMTLAVNEINAAGGVLGRPLEILRRDSKMEPGEAVRLAEELRTRDHADVLIEVDSSSAVLAVGEWAQKNKMPLVIAGAEADSLIWGRAHDYQIRVDAGGYAWVSGSLEKAMQLYGDKLKNKKWAIIAPNFEFGRSLADSAKKIAVEKGLNPAWVSEQWPTYDKINAGATVVAMKSAEPDIVLCFLFDNDLVRFIRESKKRGLTNESRLFIAPALALPDHLDMLKQELPKGWVSLGLPFNDIKAPAFVKFMKAYQAVYHADPRTYTLPGYDGIKAIAAMIEKAGSTDPDKIKAVLDNLRFDSVTGPQTVRPIDHQATVPFWVGVSDIVDGVPKLTNWTEMNIANHSPSDDDIRARREKAKE